MKYRIVIEEGIYIVECPALLGCISEGKTISTTVVTIKDSIIGYLESLKKHDAPIPSSINEEIMEVYT